MQGFLLLLVVLRVGSFIFDRISTPQSLQISLLSDSSFWYVIVVTIVAIPVLVDAQRRGNAAVGWAAGTFLLPPIGLSGYFAMRYLRTGERREGGRAWNVLKNFAIFWTLSMLVIGFTFIVRASAMASNESSAAAQVGAGLGITLGLGFQTALWLALLVGAVLLGFLLKRSVVEVGPTGPIHSQSNNLAAAEEVAQSVSTPLPRL